MRSRIFLRFASWPPKLCNSWKPYNTDYSYFERKRMIFDVNRSLQIPFTAWRQLLSLTATTRPRFNPDCHRQWQTAIQFLLLSFHIRFFGRQFSHQWSHPTLLSCRQIAIHKLMEFLPPPSSLSKPLFLSQQPLLPVHLLSSNDVYPWLPSLLPESFSHGVSETKWASMLNRMTPHPPLWLPTWRALPLLTRRAKFARQTLQLLRMTYPFQKRNLAKSGPRRKQ